MYKAVISAGCMKDTPDTLEKSGGYWWRAMLTASRGSTGGWREASMIHFLFPKLTNQSRAGRNQHPGMDHVQPDLMINVCFFLHRMGWISLTVMYEDTGGNTLYFYAIITKQVQLLWSYLYICLQRVSPPGGSSYCAQSHLLQLLGCVLQIDSQVVAACLRFCTTWGGVVVQTGPYRRLLMVVCLILINARTHDYTPDFPHKHCTQQGPRPRRGSSAPPQSFSWSHGLNLKQPQP